MKIITAEYVLPVSSEPIEKGAVVVTGERISMVGALKDASERFPDAEIEDFGHAAILPGFVNCHSHLELTSLRGALDHEEHDFQMWLLKLNSLRQGMSEIGIAASAKAGAIEGARAGVTCFGDIGRFGWAGLEALKQVGLRGVVFQETGFAPDEVMAEDEFKRLCEKYNDLCQRETELVRAGISPHSPYTVSRRLFERIAEFAAAENIRISIHASESIEEEALMMRGEGFFTAIYDKYGVEWRCPKLSTIEFLKQTGILAVHPLLVHCVSVSERDIETIALSDSSIAHCPRSNAKFGHGTAPFDEFLEAGIPVGLGSDSVASNNSCDIIAEAGFAALTARNRIGRKRFISARETLAAATIGGARSLGLDHVIGTLEPGKLADITVISLNSPFQNPIHDVEAALVFSSSGRDVLLTMVNGEAVYREGSLQKTQ